MVGEWEKDVGWHASILVVAGIHKQTQLSTWHTTEWKNVQHINNKRQIINFYHGEKGIELKKMKCQTLPQLVIVYYILLDCLCSMLDVTYFGSNTSI